MPNELEDLGTRVLYLLWNVFSRSKQTKHSLWNTTNSFSEKSDRSDLRKHFLYAEMPRVEE